MESFVAINPLGTQTLTPATIIPNLILVIVGLAASASIAVAWHRFGLLGERPGFIYLHLGTLELRFFLKSLLLGLVVFAVMFPLMLIVAVLGAVLKSTAIAPIAGVLLLICSIFLMPHFARLNLILPATAVERPIGLKLAHRLGQGLGWPMIGAGIVLSLPFMLVALGLQFLLLHVAGGFLALLIIIKIALLNVLLQIILTVLGISIITAGYRIAMERSSANPHEAPSNPA